MSYSFGLENITKNINSLANTIDWIVKNVPASPSELRYEKEAYFHRVRIPDNVLSVWLYNFNIEERSPFALAYSMSTNSVIFHDFDLKLVS